MYQIAIIGGGASGLVAAISSVRTGGGEVVILERGERVGRKLLATGNGRCNLTNLDLSHSHFHSNTPGFAQSVLQRYPTEKILNFFNEIGLLCKSEDTRVYPVTGTAASVLDCLRLELVRLGVEERCGFDAVSIGRKKGFFEIVSRDGTVILAKKVVVATGGKAAKHLGTDGSGYKLLQSLGHTVTQVFPALVQVKTNPEQVRGLKGIRVYGGVRVLQREEVVTSVIGEVLFTDYGISGIPSLDISRVIASASTGLSLSLDLLPEYSADEVIVMLKKQRRLRKAVSVEQFFTGIVHKRLGALILRKVGILKLSQYAGTLEDRTLTSICRMLKDWRLTPTGTMGWDQAQVTAGGIKCNEINPLTMESRIVPGLFIVGELLDVDGDCGGYNLHWAWSSGLTLKG